LPFWQNRPVPVQVLIISEGGFEVILTDDELIDELVTRFSQSRKAFSDLRVVNRKLLEMNNRLEQSEALRSNFLSNIRNEINNPLNAIIGLGGQMVLLAESSQDVSALASMICSEAANLDFQLRNIFIAADLEAGEVDPHIARFDAIAVVSDVVESFCHSAAKKSVSIKLEQPKSMAPLLFVSDAEKLQTIVSNFIANAMEFSHAGGDVDVSLSIDGKGWLLVAVRDYGMGIAEEDHKRIFDRFIQVEMGTTRSHPGHGLGLSIARALADLLLGTITVQSAPGEGALFTVALPPAEITEDEILFVDGCDLFVFDEMSRK
jgi:signal transduction histidine kinase